MHFMSGKITLTRSELGAVKICMKTVSKVWDAVGVDIGLEAKCSVLYGARGAFVQSGCAQWPFSKYRSSGLFSHSTGR